MGWNRECRYKVLGRVAASDRGLILVFEMEEAIMFAPKKEEFVDPVTGETKKRQVKYYPDAYKNRIGRSYTEYEQYRQLNLFEDFGNFLLLCCTRRDKRGILRRITTNETMRRYDAY